MILPRCFISHSLHWVLSLCLQMWTYFFYVEETNKGFLCFSGCCVSVLPFTAAQPLLSMEHISLSLKFLSYLATLCSQRELLQVISNLLRVLQVCFWSSTSCNSLCNVTPVTTLPGLTSASPATAHSWPSSDFPGGNFSGLCPASLHLLYFLCTLLLWEWMGGPPQVSWLCSPPKPKNTRWFSSCGLAHVACVHQAPAERFHNSVYQLTSSWLKNELLAFLWTLGTILLLDISMPPFSLAPRKHLPGVREKSP